MINRKMGPVVRCGIGVASVLALSVATPALASSIPLATPSPAVSINASGGDLDSAAKKEIAMQLVSSAENSSLD
jgi:chitosanase